MMVVWSWGFTVSDIRKWWRRCGPEDLLFLISGNDGVGVVLRIYCFRYQEMMMVLWSWGFTVSNIRKWWWWCGPEYLLFQISTRKKIIDKWHERFFLRENLPKREMTVKNVTIIRAQSVFESSDSGVVDQSPREHWHYAFLLYMYVYLCSACRAAVRWLNREFTEMWQLSVKYKLSEFNSVFN